MRVIDKMDADPQMLNAVEYTFSKESYQVLGYCEGDGGWFVAHVEVIGGPCFIAAFNEEERGQEETRMVAVESHTLFHGSEMVYV